MSTEEKKNSKKDVDKLTGVETTGHEWDGLKEWNRPAPRWWLIIFILTCIWSLFYWFLVPSWPTLSGSTKGNAELGKKFGVWEQYEQLAAKQEEIVDRQGAYLEKFEDSSFSQIQNDPALYAFATAGGAAFFKDNCATCHGTGGAGAKGYPNLNDDDWLWGGTIDDIYQTIRFGIRAPHEDTHISEMMAFGKEELLTTEEINHVVDYVMGLSKDAANEDMPGYEVFQLNCASCHGMDGEGGRDFGAPSLADDIWLYGGDRETIYETVYNGRGGLMPNWEGRLDKNTIRQLAIYVHSLGGGE